MGSLVAHVQSIDAALLRSINHGPEWLAPAMRLLSTATEYWWFKALLILLIVGMVAYGPRTRRAAVEALIAFPLANGLTDLFKHGLPTHRPFQVLPDIVLRLGASDSAGTASAHSANMAAVALVFGLNLGWQWGGPWGIVAFLVGYSRVYCGVHYPWQVLLGWTCGLAAAWAVVRTWEWIVSKRQSVSADVAHEEP